MWILRLKYRLHSLEDATWWSCLHVQVLLWMELGRLSCGAIVLTCLAWLTRFPRGATWRVYIALYTDLQTIADRRGCKAF
jgi:hypothetical protein